MKEHDAIDTTLYGAAALVVISGLLCATDLLLAVRGALWVTLAIGVTGIPASLAMRRHGFNSRRVNQVVTLLSLVGGVLLVAASTNPVRRYGPNLMLSPDLDRQVLAFLIRCIAWILACRAWTLLKDVDLLMTIGFGLSMFILLAIVEPDGLVVSCLLPFIAGSLYLVLRCQRLALRRRVDEVVGRAEAVSWRHDTRTLGSLGVWVAALSIAGSLMLSGLELPSRIATVIGMKVAARLATYIAKYQTSRLAEGVDPTMDVGDVTGGLNELPLFQVEGPGGALWRGNVYPDYDGHRWRWSGQTVFKGQEAVIGTNRYKLARDPELPPPPFNVYKFTRLSEIGGQVYTVNGAHSVELQANKLMVHANGSVTVVPTLRPGTTYKVYASRVSNRQRKVDATLDPKERKRCLSLPVGLNPKVSELAHQIAADAKDDESKLDALMQWFGDHKSYTLHPVAVPWRQEATEYFLFHMRSGWCRHFASSMAVMGRTLGIPTRIVTGYANGEATEANTVLVKGKDAHAWLEAWLPGHGWVEFDPTGMAIEELTGLAAVFNRGRERWRALVAWIWPHRGWVLAVLLALAGAATGLWWRRQRSAAVTVQRRARARQRSRGLADRWLRTLTRQLRRVGVVRSPVETELALAARGAKVVPWLAQELRDLAELVSSGRFGAQPLSREAIAHGEATLATLRRRLRRPPQPAAGTNSSDA